MIMNVYPRRGAVIGNFATDSRGNQLPSHARLLTIVLPGNIPMIFNATLQLIKQDGAVLCDEVAFNIRMNLPGVGSSCLHQNEWLLEIEFPLPKIKLAGECFVSFLSSSDDPLYFCLLSYSLSGYS